MSTLKILTAAELMALELPEPRWAVPGLMPEGLSILAGKPKLGKSWLALDLTIAVATGGRALGGIQVAEGDALYLALEDSDRRLQSRLALVLEGVAAPSRLHLACRWTRGGIADLSVWLQRHPEARLVVIDTLARFRPPTKGRQPVYSDDYNDLEPLQTLAHEHQVAIVVVHHLRKDVAEDWIDQVSGTLGLAGAADGVLVLSRARGEAQAELKVTGRDVEEQELGLHFESRVGRWALLGDAAATVELSDQRRQMVALMSQLSHPANARVLAGHVDKSRDTTRKLLQRMQAEGLVINSTAGWSLARSHARDVPLSHLSHGTRGTDGTHGTRETGETPLHLPQRRLDPEDFSGAELVNRGAKT